MQADAPSRQHFDCAVCLQLLCEPLQLPCKHAFCRGCLAIGISRVGTCPLCRQAIPDDFDAKTARVDRSLEGVIKQNWLDEYTKRQQTTSLQLRIGNRFKTICTKPRCAYRWTLFVEMEQQPTCDPDLMGKSLNDLVDRIRFDSVRNCRVFQCGGDLVSDDDALAPHFDVYSPPFELVATGWVTSATVNISIFWKGCAATPTILQHTPGP
eukprot:TRINITY_DN20795_c0_g1_i1.p1 TRINITY_DN20795_c0_g1~~TRINITY_DN20795_c0_g1_i1.p1  ORF type:complete len:210 (+),score=9.07 TRINITY_DN20795_c0_g1_i1:89-718(+)